MAAIGGLTGLGGGASGTGFAKPTGGAVMNPVSKEQTDAAYANNQKALAQQQGLLQELQGQNGIGNQSQVYNQLQGVANGTGPNPAQAALNQSTQANVANQAALMAGQRGSGSNVGLLARQAAMQGANTQQQAIGQAATMQANQSLNAMNAAGNIAGQQVGNQIGATTANTQAQQNEQQQLLNAVAGQNNANVGLQSNINNINAGLAGNVMGNQTKVVGGLLGMGGGAAGGTGGSSGGGAAGAAPAAAALARGGVVQYAGGGMAGPQSSFGQFLSGWGGVGSAPTQAPDINQGANLMPAPNNDFLDIKKKAKAPSKETPELKVGDQVTTAGEPTPTAGMMAARGGKVPALVSPGERYLPPQAVAEVASGKKNPMDAGEKIPGKPKVGGAKNDYANDTVPKELEEGGIILPRSVTQAKHPHWEAHKFVSALMAKKGLKGSK